MKILKCSESLSLMDRYNLTRNPETERMKNHVGERLHIDAYMVRQEERDDTGEIATITSIKSGEKVYATNSPTFARELLAIVALADECGETVGAIEVIEGMSNKGRPYVSCKYVEG